MTKLGRTDEITKLSELAPHLALPRERHLEVVFRIVCDPSYSELDKNDSPENFLWWCLGTTTIIFTPPKPQGANVILRLYIDSNFAGDGTTIRSRELVEARIGYRNSAFDSEWSVYQWLNQHEYMGTICLCNSQYLQTGIGAKKMNYVCYHYIRDAVAAADECCV
jgi:hypothetical protein